MIAVNYGEPLETVQKAVTERGYGAFRVLLDPGGVSLARWHAPFRPMTFLVDGAGIIRSVWVGPVSPETIQSELAKYRT